MTDDLEREPTAAALRRSLAAHAAEAPKGELLARRIIDSAGADVPVAGPPSRRGWRSWALPIVAAGAVAGVVAALVGIEHVRPTAANQPGSPTPSVLSTQQPTPLPTTSAPESPAPTTVPAVPSKLANVRIADLTFVGDDVGWALGSADCVGGRGRCTAVLRTTDGTHWTGMSGAAFNVIDVKGCADPCVTNLRFANGLVGYAFGPSAFYVTTDGGRSWHRRPGGAIQLETLDNNVIRVTGTNGGCPGPCNIRVETAAIGSSSWTPADFIPNQLDVSAVLLSREGHDAYLLLTGNPAGGAPSATSTLYRSRDDGRTWQAVGEPCPQTGQEVDSTAIAAGGADRVSALCATRQSPQRYRVATSVDAGSHFVGRPANVPLDRVAALAGDPDTALVAAGSGLARSTDGGVHWHRIAEVTGTIQFVGFESMRVGRAVSQNGTRIWTTRDAGRTWQPATIG
jgi:photosystem II stability/assembly factor-like uncharacterized protein